MRHTDIGGLLKNNHADFLALLVGQLLQSDGGRKSGGTTAHNQNINLIRFSRLLTRIIVLCDVMSTTVKFGRPTKTMRKVNEPRNEDDVRKERLVTS